MTDILLIIFTASLLYVSIANRLRGFIKILVFQGLLLFIIAFIQLSNVNIINLILILLETIIFKTIAVPLFLNYIIKRNKITRETEPFVSYFVSLIIVTFFVIASFLLVQQLEGIHFRIIFFVVALSTLFTGLYVIITRRKIITHVMGYLVIENGVFILSLAVGSEMPMLVNFAIILDVFVSALVLGVFINRIGDTFEEMNVGHLTKLKD